MEIADVFLIALQAMWDEVVVVGSASVGFATLCIVAYRKGPARKRRVAEKKEREEKEWCETLDQRLRKSGLGP